MAVVTTANMGLLGIAELPATVTVLGSQIREKDIFEVSWDNLVFPIAPGVLYTLGVGIPSIIHCAATKLALVVGHGQHMICSSYFRLMDLNFISFIFV